MYFLQNRYKYEDEDDANWLVDDKDSSEDDGSQEWSPSEDESKVFADQRFVKSDAKSDGETASDGKDSDEVWSLPQSFLLFTSRQTAWSCRSVGRKKEGNFSFFGNFFGNCYLCFWCFW